MRRNRIYNGNNANQGMFPGYIKILIYMTTQQQTFESMCGATLINADTVITAAHCVQIYNGVKIREHHIVAIDANGVVYNEGVRVCLDPKYSVIRQVEPLKDIGTYDYDAAIIVFRCPFELSSNTWPACFPSRRSELSDKCAFAGFGGINTYLSRPSTLQYMTVKRAWCRADLGLDRSRICFGSEHGNATVCAGDCGGGVICLSDDGKAEIHGILSYGSSRCAHSDRDIDKYAYYYDTQLRLNSINNIYEACKWTEPVIVEEV